MKAACSFAEARDEFVAEIDHVSAREHFPKSRERISRGPYSRFLAF